jgi:UDP-glucose 4-epimerase
MKILITGGTGTIGKALIKKFCTLHDIRVFSRDELKQAQLKIEYPNVEFMIGDVRDYCSVLKSMRNVDIVIHAAAMKLIENFEQWPIEAVKTNVLGTENVINAALEKNIKQLVSIGSDKGVEPINVYGMTKAMQEKITTSAGYNCVRYGNVLGSRGSVIPLFQEQISKKQPLTVTDPEMTRFVLTINEALNIIMKAIESNMEGNIFVKKLPATRIEDIANAMSNDIKIIGSFACEKKHEVLVSSEEMTRTKEEDDYYIIQRNLINYIQKEKYSSDKTTLLTIPEIKKYLKEYYDDSK